MLPASDAMLKRGADLNRYALDTKEARQGRYGHRDRLPCMSGASPLKLHLGPFQVADFTSP